MNYQAECYIKELRLMPVNGAKIAFEPANGWMVERDSVKYLVLAAKDDKDDEAGKVDKMDDKEGEKAVLVKNLSCEVKSPSDGCLLPNLLRIKLNKARVRIEVSGEKKDGLWNWTLVGINVI